MTYFIRQERNKLKDALARAQVAELKAVRKLVIDFLKILESRSKPAATSTAGIK
ncbi:hypothetical protein M1146_03395 [Patescibacteria group bacterium]|nr:hypothetical protein [Patescibacteria group bacterium]